MLWTQTLGIPNATIFCRGRILEQGRHAELLELNGAYKRIGAPSNVPRLFDNMMLTKKQQLRETMQECRFSFFLMVYFLWFISPLTWLDVADPCGSQNLQHDSIKFNQWHAHFFEAAQPSTSQGRCSFPPSWDLRIWTETRSFSLKKLGVPYVSDLSDVKLPGCTKYSTGPVVQLILLIFLLFWGDGNHHIVAHIGIVISCYIIGG